MDENKSNEHTETEPSLTWYGCQFQNRVKGTNEIIQRSFPFWAPSIEFAIDHAKKSNKLSKEERTYWNILVVLQKITETKNGAKKEEREIYEVKI